eukprot:TRINITY_DN3628_c1_g1_i1.p1 TRINITY_DN3628_c1_g1~~TRINITY_DN3628_c1_g1_i1.p1  ORF type:complete len:308 (+),score=140.03 TRINITY_DN3628_c1_g1_i1:117-1040(+)
MMIDYQDNAALEHEIEAVALLLTNAVEQSARRCARGTTPSCGSYCIRGRAVNNYSSGEDEALQEDDGEYGCYEEEVEEDQQQEEEELVENAAAAFEACTPPVLTLQAFLQRLVKYGNLTRGMLVACLILLDRVLYKHPQFTLSYGNVYRLYLMCIVAAQKMYEDVFYTQTFYSRVGDVALEEMDLLETELLKLLQFELWIGNDVYVEYDATLTATIDACKKAADRTKLHEQRLLEVRLHRRLRAGEASAAASVAAATPKLKLAPAATAECNDDVCEGDECNQDVACYADCCAGEAQSPELADLAINM